MDTQDERHDERGGSRGGKGVRERHPRGVYRFRTLEDSDKWEPARATLVPHRDRGQGTREGDAESEAEGQADRTPDT